MESSTVASKALVQVSVLDPGGLTSHQCIMDINFDNGAFHCKFRTRAQLNDSVKKAFVYLLLDASHIRSLETCDDEAIPHSVITAFSKRAIDTSSNGITALRFTLKSQASLIVPDLILHKKSSYEDLNALLQIGQCARFKIYMLSSALNSDCLSSLCSALDEDTLQPAPGGVINSLYVNTSYKRITHVDQLWSSNPTGSPSSDEPSTALGVSNSVSPGPSNPTPSSGSRGHGKRRSISPGLLQMPSKRQALTEDAAENPFKIIFEAQKAQEARIAALEVDLANRGTETTALRAELSTSRAQVTTLQAEVSAQGFQMTALRAELSALCEQIQQPQQAPVVDTEIQSDPPEYEAVIAAEADLPDEAHTPASTVEDPTHDQFMMFGETFDERFAEKFEELFVNKFEEIFEENFDEVFDKKIEGRLYKVEMDLLDEAPFRWKLEERLRRKIENVRVDLEEKLEDSNKQVCVH